MIPNALIEKFLASELKLKLASEILLPRVNPNDDEFGHVISYRSTAGQT